MVAPFVESECAQRASGIRSTYKVDDESTKGEKCEMAMCVECTKCMILYASQSNVLCIIAEEAA